MRPALSRRLAAAFSFGLPTQDERQRVLDAAQRPGTATFGDLPADIQALVTRLEIGPAPLT